MNKEKSFLVKVFLGWVIFLISVVYLSTNLFECSSSYPQFFGCGLERWRENRVLCSFANFDGVHYLGIAQIGYMGFEQAFFPLYPVVVRGGSLLTGSYLVSGFLVSLIFFWFGLNVFYKLVRLDYKEDVVRWAVLFLALFPTSFFFAGAYTESLFLFLVLSFFYLLRKEKWFLAGVVGLLAGATRFIGVFLVFSYLWEYYKKGKGGWGWFYSFLVFVGLSGYMLFLKSTTGDSLAFLHSQSVWQRESFILFPQVIWRYLKIFGGFDFHNLIYWVAVLEFVVFLSFLAILILNIKKIRCSYLIFGFISIIVPSMTGTLMSIGRFALLVFPVFILMGSIKNRSVKISLLVVFVVLEVVLLSYFSRGYFIA